MSSAMDGHGDDVGMAIATDPTVFDDLLGHLLDLTGMHVDVRGDSFIMRGLPIVGTHTGETDGHRWASVVLGEQRDAELLFADVTAVRWLTQDEMEWLAVVDREGTRNVSLFVLPGQPQPPDMARER